jgi:hypothetical protein
MAQNLVTQRFARLCVRAQEQRLRSSGHTREVWCLVSCECDASRTFWVRASHLVSGRTKSCGCLKREVTAARNRESVKHGKYGTLLYRCWTHIVQRTTNPRNKAFPLYGGRGITLYPPWLHDPAAFIAYIEQVLGERPSAYHSLDRKDNNGNYEPGNLRWATSSEQARNRRDNVSIRWHDGSTVTLAEVSERVGVALGTLWRRKNRGWTDAQILAGSRL